MRIQQPLSKWNNFAVPELKEILIHCTALERLGIAQDEEMMRSIEKDISMRENSNRQHSKPKLTKIKQTEKQKQTQIKKEQPSKLLLEQTV